MGSASSKKNQESKFSHGQSGEPGVLEILSIGSETETTIEKYVNTTSEINGGIKEVKNNVVDNVKRGTAGACDDTLGKGVSEKKYGIKSKRAWDNSYGRREFRFRSKERCLVGLENIRKTASPQLLMASRENYGRIKDASELLLLQPSQTDVSDIKPRLTGTTDIADHQPNRDIKNLNIFREVSDIASKGPMDVPKCDNAQVQENIVRENKPSRLPRPCGHEKSESTNVSPGGGKASLNVSPPYLKSDFKTSSSLQKGMPEDSSGLLHGHKIRSRDNSLDRVQGRTIDGKTVASLGPLRYGKLSMQGGAIRKELEKEGILGACSDKKKNPDVVLRELRQIGLVRQTGSGTSYSLNMEEEIQNHATLASRLPPLEFEALCRKLEEKDKRHNEQMQKNESERLEKVQKFRERHKSAKARRQQLQQQQQGETELEAERLKLKMLDVDLL